MLLYWRPQQDIDTQSEHYNDFNSFSSDSADIHFVHLSKTQEWMGRYWATFLVVRQQTTRKNYFFFVTCRDNCEIFKLAKP